MTLHEAFRTIPDHRQPTCAAWASAPSPGSLQPVFIPAGAGIYAQGEKSDRLYQVEFGAVRVYRLFADGRRQISAFHLCGEVFGFEAHSTHHFFAEAICATGIRMLHTSPHRNGLADELLPVALQGLARAQEHLLLLGRQNAAERVAAFLIEMSERQGGLDTVELPMSRTDIADYLGLTIETVSRVLSRLRQKGIISLPTLRSIEIVKRSALRDMAA